MDLNVKKFNDLIIDNCGILIECHTELTPLLEKHEFNGPKRSVTDRYLVRMSVASRKILDLVFPLPSTGEVMGLPEEMTQTGYELDVLIVDKDNPNWDFKPWFVEKATIIRDSVNKLIEHLESEIDPTEGDIFMSLLRSYMAEIKDKANSILYMIHSGRLSIADVKLDGVDD